MVSRRPLLYLSPIAILITGIFWIRRRNKTRGKDDKKIEVKMDDDPKSVQFIKKPKQSASMNINGSITIDDETAASKTFGKSAPIEIIHSSSSSSRTSPHKQTQIDSDILCSKIQVAEKMTLRVIEEDYENLSSSVDLPDSMQRPQSFYMRPNIRNKKEPVVIKASASPKISPENSFLESPYTDTCNKENEDINTIETNITSKKDNISECLDTSHVNDIAKDASYSIEANAVDDNSSEHVIDDNIKENDNSEEESKDIHTEKDNVETSTSPVLSVGSSTQSGDSGKGSSLPRSEANRKKTTYEFFFPTSLIGRLYGPKRAFLNSIKAATSANVVLKKNPFSHKIKICIIEGTESEINAALMLIRDRLPSERYPNLTMQRIHFVIPQSVVPLTTETRINLQIHLIEGMNNDVTVCHVVSGGHFFVHQSLHPSHPALQVLQKKMYETYNTSITPGLPSLELNAICVIMHNDIWYRVQIVQVDSDNSQRCVIKFLDFGGYLNVDWRQLRQIKADFMSTPFQATECILSNVQPIGEFWSPESAEMLFKLTAGIVLQAQIAGYNSHKIPEVLLFACRSPNNVIFINKELAARNLAVWVD